MPKRKRNASKSHESATTDGKEKAAGVDVNHSILGGLKDPTLNSRISGEETTTSEGVHTFKVAYRDKYIICESRGPSESSTTALLFTHGAGGGLANPATREFATGFAQVSSVATFQGTMNLQSRVSTFHTMLEHEHGVWVLGGRSMGARAAVIAATESSVTIKAVVLVSYPLIGGKAKPDRRDQILYDLPTDTDVLFIVGDKDAQCPLDVLEMVRKKMEGRTWLVVVEGADHSMSLKQKAQVKDMREKTGELAARWVAEHDAIPTTSVLRCDENGVLVLNKSEVEAMDDQVDKQPKVTPKKRRQRRE